MIVGVETNALLRARNIDWGHMRIATRAMASIAGSIARH
jgi:hypothetical protein